MPIKLQDGFPAKDILEKENIFAIDNEQAIHQDIRPLRVLLVNLMPNKIDTEIQLLRLISKTPLQIDVDFLKMESHVSKNTSLSHLSKFYLSFNEIKDQYYDGMIITGAPLEHLEFSKVDYWNEICEVMKWSNSHVFSTVHICWGAQAGLYYHYGINKIDYNEKLFGIYAQKLCSHHFLVDGFDDIFHSPQSRYTGIDEDAVKKHPDLQVLSESDEVGINILMNTTAKHIFILGHLEYDANTLENEYKRDIDKGVNINIPYNYFPDDDTKKIPLNTWRSHANLLYHNWLNFVYQQTPYDLKTLESYRK